MARMASITLLVVLACGTFSLCSAEHGNGAGQRTSPSEKSASKTIRITGRVGLAGKTVVNDRDKRVWKVLNPDFLSSSEGRLVRIKAYATADSSEIRVAVVTLREERTTAKLDDAAFRR